jgi:hypothetical protein
MIPTRNHPETVMLLDLPQFTLIHVLLSLLGIFSGLVMVGAMMSGTTLARWTTVFLVTTILTSITGFGFPFTTIQPPHIFGVLSLIALTIALVALYGKRLAGGWRRTFAITAVFSLYLNVFVLVAQLLQKTPVLASIAPDPGSPVFGATQALILIIFLVLGWTAVKRF